MNFRLSPSHSVVLMSVRKNAPYNDHVEEEGRVLIYEGHDESRTADCPVPKIVDQPRVTAYGKLTQNGKFFEAAESYKTGVQTPELVRVYEKIHQGIWVYAGTFRLADAWQESDGTRQVFRFRLEVTDDPDSPPTRQDAEPNRVIPTDVKLAVWKRDQGKCVMCGSSDELHFDHVIPFSKGGSSNTAANVQLLCARHNLQKHDRIQ